MIISIDEDELKWWFHVLSLILSLCLNKFFQMESCLALHRRRPRDSLINCVPSTQKVIRIYKRLQKPWNVSQLHCVCKSQSYLRWFFVPFLFYSEMILIVCGSLISTDRFFYFCMKPENICLFGPKTVDRYKKTVSNITHNLSPFILISWVELTEST